ncbi:MAG: universal stress protein [Bacteroidetes bacterium]|nr:universal stress protein [Bacteroidota bacterium]
MKNTDTQPILIPYDFTSVSDIAIEHAANLAKLAKKSLILLNILDDSTLKFLKSHDKMDQFLKTNLENLSNKVSKKYNVPTDFLIKKGNILSITDMAKELSISYMFIGIDQPHTLASKIFKMIGNSPAPVYVVQGDIKWKSIKTIVFPVDSFEETRQKISCTIKVARINNSTVKLFSIFLRNKERQYYQDVRLKQIEKLLQTNEIPYTSEYAKEDEEKFPDELLKYAEENKSDLFILMKTPRLYFSNLFINPVDKKILLNAMNIPSIYVNPKDIGIYGLS